MQPVGPILEARVALRLVCDPEIALCGSGMPAVLCVSAGGHTQIPFFHLQPLSTTMTLGCFPAGESHPPAATGCLTL